MARKRKRTITYYQAIDPYSPTVVAPPHKNLSEYKKLLKTRYRQMLLERHHPVVIIEKVTKKTYLIPTGEYYFDKYGHQKERKKWMWFIEDVQPVARVRVE